ncbi:DUF3299 domain-containing protein [Azospira restricta]|uniref:DUF3299 domain-containing protein n=1 Tax=Azospira restricta TaxID=404405 RepID=A0A974PW93_9RHOO|nr:DUF3299 domain-containing protein [Azospira restricta]QRJ62359.1 DUF3299 domain-containing protein [Azospira restricta]
MRTLLLILSLLVALPLQAADAYPEIKWEELVPKGWNPAKDLQALDFNNLKDSDPRALEAMEKMKALWDNAPTEPALAGKKVRLPGFVIPLERKGEQVTEFLLVPYFGACIHSPPPPANQIIHAVSAKPLGKMQTMDPVWLSGTLALERADTPWGKAGYRITVDKVVPYQAPKRK